MFSKLALLAVAASLVCSHPLDKRDNAELTLNLKGGLTPIEVGGKEYQFSLFTSPQYFYYNDSYKSSGDSGTQTGTQTVLTLLKSEFPPKSKDTGTSVIGYQNQPHPDDLTFELYTNDFTFPNAGKTPHTYSDVPFSYTETDLKYYQYAQLDLTKDGPIIKKIKSNQIAFDVDSALNGNVRFGSFPDLTSGATFHKFSSKTSSQFALDNVVLTLFGQTSAPFTVEFDYSNRISPLSFSFAGNGDGDGPGYIPCNSVDHLGVQIGSQNISLPKQAYLGEPDKPGYSFCQNLISSSVGPVESTFGANILKYLDVVFDLHKDGVWIKPKSTF